MCPRIEKQNLMYGPVMPLCDTTSGHKQQICAIGDLQEELMLDFAFIFLLRSTSSTLVKSKNCFVLMLHKQFGWSYFLVDLLHCTSVVFCGLLYTKYIIPGCQYIRNVSLLGVRNT